MNKYTFKRVSVWLIVNAALGWCAWEALHGHIPSGRVFGFLCWFSFIVTVIASLSDDIKAKIRKAGRPVPEWLDDSYTAALAVACIWHGWIMIATIIVIQHLFDGANRREEEAK